MSIEGYSPKDNNNGRVPLPRGESLNPHNGPSNGIEGIPIRNAENVLFDFRKLPDPIGEMVTLYKQGMGVVGKLHTAARIMDDIVEGPQKTSR